MLKCQLCEYEHETMISPSHLKAKHSLTGQEYKTLFPGSVLRIQSPASKLKISAKNAGKSAVNKGIPASPEQKLKQSETMRAKYQNGLVHSRAGISLSEETKNKISVGNKGRSLTPDQRNRYQTAMEDYRNSERFVPPMLGKNHTEATKRKISHASRAKANEDREKLHLRNIDIAAADGLEVQSTQNNYWYTFRCLSCSSTFTFSKQVFFDSTRGGKKICPTCHPRKSIRSAGELELFEFVNSLQPAISGDRLALHGKEIDVYCPSVKIGFEYTGLYWHSEKVRGEPNHLLWKQQFAHKEGIRLITIFEDEWELKKEIAKSRIKAILGIFDRKLNARSCDIREVPSKERTQFLSENHLQGKDTASIGFGLYLQNELVSLGTFKKTNMVKGGSGDEWELSRFCSKLNCSVRGGFNRIVKHFLATANTESLDLISYADRRWSDGSLYSQCGFSFDGVSKPSYWYFGSNCLGREHRSKYMKHKLVQTNEDRSFTEAELAARLGLNRIYDCGTTKWRLSEINSIK